MRSADSLLADASRLRPRRKAFGGGLGGYARYIAVSPPDWPYGETIGLKDAPLPKSEKPLHYDAAAGMRIR
jgi:hypothetical protein